jgi:RimJ/RimL family protein N-acetyltransferase
MTNNFNFRIFSLHNDLIRLHPLDKDDFEKLYLVASDAQIWEVHPSKDRYKREVFRDYFDGAVSSGSAFLIYDQVSGELIGSSRYYDLQPDNSTVAIGYTFLGRKYWGGEYNKSLKSLMLDYAFQNVNKVIFHIGTTNYRSQKAIEKLGAIKSKEIDFESGGVLQPHFEYEISKQNWYKNPDGFVKA